MALTWQPLDLCQRQCIMIWRAGVILFPLPVRPLYYHYNDVIMGTTASQITSLTTVYSIVYLGVDQRKHQSSASLAFVRGIHRWPVTSPHKGSVTQKMFPFDDVIMPLIDNRYFLHMYQVPVWRIYKKSVIFDICVTVIRLFQLKSNPSPDIKFTTTVLTVQSVGTYRHATMATIQFVPPSIKDVSCDLSECWLRKLVPSFLC